LAYHNRINEIFDNAKNNRLKGDTEEDKKKGPKGMESDGFMDDAILKADKMKIKHKYEQELNNMDFETKMNFLKTKLDAKLEAKKAGQGNAK
jgi:hypothetical protein